MAAKVELELQPRPKLHIDINDLLHYRKISFCKHKLQERQKQEPLKQSKILRTEIIFNHTMNQWSKVNNIRKSVLIEKGLLLSIYE